MKDTTRSLGEFVATGAVFASRTLLAGVQIITDGTNLCDVILHDNAAAASGTKVFEGGVAALSHGQTILFDNPVKCEEGLYLTLTGTGASCIVYIG